MKRIIGIGETHYDILFRDSEPYKGEPSGFAFNSVISLGRLGLNPILISEVGNDFIGDIIINMLKVNGVATENMYRFYDARSALNVVSCDAENNSNTHTPYVKYPSERLDIVWPRIDINDIIYFGSHFSLDNNVRKHLVDIITYAIDRKSIIFYDVDYDSSYKNESVWLMPAIIENLEFADIVLGNLDDFINIYKDSDIDKVYWNHIKFYCTNFICIDSYGDVILKTESFSKKYKLSDNQKVLSKSARDSFNAGIIFGFYKNNIEKEKLNLIEENIWDEIINFGILFTEDINTKNQLYISQELAKSIKI